MVYLMTAIAFSAISVSARDDQHVIGHVEKVGNTNPPDSAPTDPAPTDPAPTDPAPTDPINHYGEFQITVIDKDGNPIDMASVTICHINPSTGEHVLIPLPIVTYTGLDGSTARLRTRLPLTSPNYGLWSKIEIVVGKVGYKIGKTNDVITAYFSEADVLYKTITLETLFDNQKSAIPLQREQLE